MFKPSFTTYVIVPLVALAILATVVFGFVYQRATIEGQGQIEIEIAKSMLQIVTVAIIGALVTMLVKVYEERRKAWVARRDLLRADLTERLGVMYSRSKQIRRQLRAATNQERMCLEYSKYVELLEEISDIQLNLERLRSAAEAGARQKIIPESVAADLHSMEQYLGKLVTEYESVERQQDQTVAIGDGPLSDFTAKAKERKSTFKAEFSSPFHDASSAIEQVIETDLRRI